MASAQTLTEQIRDWFEHSPTAQRAVKKFSEDLDLVASKVEQVTSGLMERVGPIIDPPAHMAAPDEGTIMSESQPAEQDTEPVIPESESSVPPGVKKDGEPVDPTT
jgi:hypothetical protein